MTPESRLKLSEMHHVSIVVRDLDRTIEYYTKTFGWGPFRTREIKQDGVLFNGRQVSWRQRLAFGKAGSLELELIQTVEGETPHTEFLREKGEGIHHICFRVDDLGAVLAELAKDGVKPVCQKSQAEFAFAYLQSNNFGGVMLELIELRQPPGSAERERQS